MQQRALLAALITLGAALVPQFLRVYPSPLGLALVSLGGLLLAATRLPRFDT